MADGSYFTNNWMKENSFFNIWQYHEIFNKYTFQPNISLLLYIPWRLYHSIHLCSTYQINKTSFFLHKLSDQVTCNTMPVNKIYYPSCTTGQWSHQYLHNELMMSLFWLWIYRLMMIWSPFKNYLTLITRGYLITRPIHESKIFR